jgi:hypothetical protein
VQRACGKERQWDSLAGGLRSRKAVGQQDDGTVGVPDRRSRNIPEVVLVRRWAVGVLGIWEGEGLGEEWGKGGQFTSNLRPRWTIPVTARRVPSK